MIPESPKKGIVMQNRFLFGWMRVDRASCIPAHLNLDPDALCTVDKALPIESRHLILSTHHQPG